VNAERIRVTTAMSVNLERKASIAGSLAAAFELG
jgi:hypothetical protein